MKNGLIKVINGPVVIGSNMADFKMREMVVIGDKKLIGEVVKIDGDLGTIQVYEETSGLKRDEQIISTGSPLSVKLGPGMIKNMFDGIQRPLTKIRSEYGNFMPEGIGLISIDEETLWDVKLSIKVGDRVEEGQIFATVPETAIITHRLLVPMGVNGTVIDVVPNGKYNIEKVVAKIEDDNGKIYELKMYQEWPVRIPRPIKERLPIDRLLVSGQRVFDVFFPIAKGGTAAIPGGFGTGKTMTQHQIAKYCDADIIVYIGCGERGNEMTEVLEDFPKLIDPNTGNPLMDRTILIANTSNMPVAAREASIYTGVTIAEYFRDQGYHVALMADSTSRWAEALREISGRLEEMPAEEGYPAYLPSRIAQFYERAGYVDTLSGDEGSVTLIGAVSPVGGDFSEPVTENTKRFVNVFLALDKELAYARHYPAINWMNSYSQYVSLLKNYYDMHLDGDLDILRSKFLDLLHQEAKLNEIVMLVGEDVLPDNQRLILEICRVVKVGFLQQNAFNKIDTFVPLTKQFEMLKTIDLLYECGKAAADNHLPISKIKDDTLYSRVINMKYDIENDHLEKFVELNNSIRDYYANLEAVYE
ncbi:MULTISPECIES: V-type ATP synthase subunit A [Peptoniphilus]|uniref:V-type ATP synthase subunit A n=1 Tax=Peptoniphilus TaxID=162289 RepID=UPI0001DAA040|nr:MULTISPECIES: V-type ATP synthase subunit A [Peptoniphilus]EFI41611.1 ATP synthase ab domain protein [Peptoniphilus sp. oral taxon 386 str. F0131]